MDYRKLAILLGEEMGLELLSDFTYNILKILAENYYLYRKEGHKIVSSEFFNNVEAIKKISKDLGKEK